mgnify:CR=1 FL=1
MKAKESPAIAEAACEVAGKVRVRDRIFDTACEMFYRQGIRAVGVDAIACEAGTNKMSFYRSFPSKDELVAEYLREAARNFWNRWDHVVAPHEGDPRRQALALFEMFMDKPCGRTDRGCAMANAAVEIREDDHPGLAVVRSHKNEIRRRFRALARAMKARDPDALGDGLTLLLQGAYSSLLVFPNKSGPSVSAARTARTLIAAHVD